VGAPARAGGGVRPDDAALAAREPLLAPLLDDDALGLAIRSALPGVDGARATYLRWKPGTSALAAVTLRAGEETHLGYVRVLPSARKRERLAAGARAPSPLGPGAAHLPGAAVLLLAPNDARLPGLAAVASRGDRVLSWKPERRWVARTPGGDATLRLQRPADHARAVRALRAVRAASRLRLPPLLAVDPARSLLVAGWLEGAALDGLLARDPAAAATAGAALAALHALPPPSGLPVLDGARELASVRAAAAGVDRLLASGSAGAVAGRLSPWLADATRPRTLHGDASADQVVLGAGAPGLIDLDEACGGDPAWDLGSFLADLERRVALGALPRAVATRAGAALLDGYVAAGGTPPPDASLAARTAAGILRRAAEPFRRRAPGWRAATEVLVARAAELAPAPPVVRRAWPRPGGVAVELEAPASGAPRAAVAPALTGPFTLVAPAADASLPGLAAVLARPGAQLRSHRAGRRAVVALPDRYVKVVRPAKLPGVLAGARAALALAGESRGRWRAPDVLAVDDALGLVELAPLPGRTLHALLGLGPSAAARAAGAAGGAVGALHATAGATLAAVHDPAAEHRVLADWCGHLAAVDRSLAERAAARAAALEIPEPAALAPVHRDLHDRQVLLDGDAVGLLDFDTVVRGDPSLDVANLLVHVELRVLQGACSPPAAEAAARAFLGALLVAPPASALAAYADAARVRLACVYRLRPRWAHLAPALLHRVGAPLPGGLGVERGDRAA